MIPIVLHVPHASRQVPASERGDLLLDDDALEQELLAMTDAWTDELVRLDERYDVCSVIAPVSRLVCDVERFRDDEQESMSAVGMGAVYQRTSTGTALRALNAATRNRILETYYDPHHLRFTEAVDESLAIHGSCLVIDVHSFPSKPLPYERDQSTDRPELCIGFDGTHGRFLDEDHHYWLSASRRAGFNADANRPFEGSIVPAKHLGNDNVLSVMLEVRRDMYMEESTGARRGEFDDVVRKLGMVVAAVVNRANEHVEC